MKAIKVIDKKLVCDSAEKPKPGRDEILINVKAAGVNRADIFQKQGTYNPPPGAPEILGMEVAGEIAEIGSGVKKFQLGEKVCAIIPGGGYAEYAVAPYEQVLPIPDGLDFRQAAALPEAFFTAFYAIFTKGKLRKGGTLLVHGGASGVGIAVIQLALQDGAKIFATAGTEEKCAFLKNLGIEKAINYRHEDFAPIIKEHGGVDVILDMVGGDYFQKNLDVLKMGGHLVQIAFLASAKAEVNFAPLLMKDLTIVSFRMRNLDKKAKAEIARELREKIWPLISSGKISLVIDSVFRLEEAEKAHARMEANLNIGKIVLINDAPGKFS